MTNPKPTQTLKADVEATLENSRKKFMADLAMIRVPRLEDTQMRHLSHAIALYNHKTTQSILALIEEKVVEALERMIEELTPPEIHPDWKWPCKICGFSPPLKFTQKREKND